MSSEAIRFLRAAFRLSHKLPSHIIARKFRFNAREAVEFYTNLSDSNLSANRLARGWKFLATLNKMLTSDVELAMQIFKPFHSVEKPSTTCTKVDPLCAMSAEQKSEAASNERLKAMSL